MRYAIFSDIHGNLPAWERVLEDIRDSQADVLICLGDVVGYGPKPQEVLDGIRAETDHFVLGNHDAAAAGIIDPSIFNDHAHAVVIWTRDALSQESLEFINQIPLELETPELVFVHAEVAEPGRFGYIDNEADAAASFAAREHFATFVGHTHHPECFERSPDGQVRRLGDQDRTLDSSCRYIINVGSVGEPRNPDDIRARYVIYDDDTRQVYFRRIDFDPNVYRDQLRATTMAHTPYFIQVLENQAAVASEVRDMEVLAQSVSSVAATRRTLLTPDTGSEIAVKPNLAPTKSKKSSRKLVPVIIATTVAIVAGLVLWYQFRAPEAVGIAAADSSSLIAAAREESDVAGDPAELAETVEAVDLPDPVFAIDASQPKTWKAFTPHRRHRNKHPSLSKHKTGNLRSLYFDGRDDLLHSKAVLKAGDESFTYIALFKPHLLGKDQVVFEQAGRGEGARASLQLVDSGFRFCGQNNDSIRLGKIERGKWQLVAMVLNGEENYNVIAIHNDSPPVLATIDMAKQNLGNQGFRVGVATFGNADKFKGEIASIEVYDKVLSSAQLKYRLTKLQERWGLDFEFQIPEIEAKD